MKQFDMRDDKFQDECGVFGVITTQRQVARLIHFGLFALQHRGQESAGMAVWDGADLNVRKGMGLVSDVFDDRNLDSLKGTQGVGHVRYSTTGGSLLANAGPFDVDTELGFIVVAHNGNVVNAAELRQELNAQGVRLNSTTDSEVIAQVLARAPGLTWPEKLYNGASRLRGAFSLSVLTRDKLYAIRDPFGIRPLCLGQMNDGDGWAISSETCALDTIGATYEREVEPGEIVELDVYGHTSLSRLPRWEAPEHQSALCAAELFYIARPDSVIAGQSVYLIRENLGRYLAKEHPVEADLVIGVPDSGIPAATGYAQQSGLPYREGLIKNRYIGRTFIQPDQQMRRRSVQLKLNPLRPMLEGKRVVVIDDSIVRGNTTKGIVHMLRTVGGAKEVHLRISAPPVLHPCVLGIDTGTYEELIGNRLTIEQIRQHVDADSLGYLSVESFAEATGLPRNHVCLACFNGRYPVDFKYTPGGAKLALERA
ncbi:MAG TPA: amidophosphoribosyltransferase [Chloroflexia bacterium]|nr:amidophosphoribosyltransferase [Chloroflexia bacterium]